MTGGARVLLVRSVPREVVMNDQTRRCSECGGTTYTGYEKGGIPECMRTRGHEGEHGYLVEYWETWRD